MGIPEYVRKEEYDLIKEELDKLRSIIELIAIGTSWDEFKEMYDEYKNGNDISLIERRIDYAFDLGYKTGIKRGEQLELDKDKK